MNDNITFNVNLIPIPKAFGTIGAASLMYFIFKIIIVFEYLSIYALSHFSIITKPLLILIDHISPTKMVVGPFRKKILWLFLLLVSVLHAQGQSFEDLQNAFSKSYEFESAEEYTKAINDLVNVYQVNSYEINVRLGWLSYLAGSYPKSSTYYEKAIELKPYSVEAMLGYTYPLSVLGNWGQVKAQYFKILEIDAMNTFANYNLGLIFYNAGDFGTALKHFEKVVNQYPFDYDGTIMFAWTHFKLGKLREAEVLFKKALLMKPGDKSAMEGLELVK